MTKKEIIITIKVSQEQFDKLTTMMNEYNTGKDYSLDRSKYIRKVLFGHTTIV